MKNKLAIIAVVSAIGLSSGLAQSSPSKSKTPSGTKALAFGEAEKATPITREEAMKKYPPRGKDYPTADLTKGPEATASTSDLESPYPPHHRFDCTAIPRGGLVLDPYVKHVFIKP